MKTAISLPDALFRRAERFAKTTKTSRSRLYALALEEYLVRHEKQQSLEAWNDLGPKLARDPAWRAWIRAGYRSMKDVEW